MTDWGFYATRVSSHTHAESSPNLGHELESLVRHNVQALAMQVENVMGRVGFSFLASLYLDWES